MYPRRFGLSNWYTRAMRSVIAAILVLAPADALACMCIDVPPLNALEEHDAVFEGRVISVDHRGGELVVELEVVQHWKGIETERATVRTAESSAACGVSFEVETSWLVYADREGDALTTGICSRTRRIEDAEADIAAFGAGVVPIEIGPDDAVEEPNEPPARGGCGSCSVGSRSTPSFVFLLIALATLARRSGSPSRRRREGVGGRGRGQLPLSLLLLGCGAPQVASDPLPDLESQLFERSLDMRVHTEAEGMIAASFDGELVLDHPRASLRFTGTFAGEPRHPWLELGERMRGGPREGETAFDVQAPPHAFEAIAIGFARMGVLHNLARLSSGEPPDHAGGGARAWLTAEDVRTVDGEIHFRLLVDGEPSAETQLRTTHERLPASRTMTVHFPEGDMHVRERYDL